MAKQPEKRNIFRPQQQAEIQHPTTLDHITIQKAFVYGERQAQRAVEDHGRINRQTLRELGARFVRSKA